MSSKFVYFFVATIMFVICACQGKSDSSPVRNPQISMELARKCCYLLCEKVPKNCALPEECDCGEECEAGPPAYLLKFGWRPSAEELEKFGIKGSLQPFPIECRSLLN